MIVSIKFLLGWAAALLHCAQVFNLNKKKMLTAANNEKLKID